jgi:hypothetical protein
MQLTSPKSGFGAVLAGSNIFICGGNDGSKILSTCEVYNVGTKSWKSLASLKHKRDELAVTIGLDKKIYAVGGFGGPLKYHHRY